LHGFLSYLIRCNVEGRKYTVFGYKGKQVRDNIHAFDVARFIHEFFERPRCGEVYNIGGGRANSVSMLEAFDRIEQLSGRKMNYDYVERNREGDHICYISDLTKARVHYPAWDITRSIDAIFEEIYAAALEKREEQHQGETVAAAGLRRR
jgi:CDP-paratose 2-epimerase